MSQHQSPGFGAAKHLVQFCLAMVITALFINASGIQQWAQRLEIGNQYVPRQTLVEITGAWEQLIEHTGLNNIRRSVMAYRDSRDVGMQTDVESQRTVGNTPSIKEHLASQSNVFPKESENKISTQSVNKDKAQSSLPESKSNADAPLPITIPGASSQTYIALVGDSMMAVGLAPNLKRMIEKNSLGKVVHAYKSGTGLARPDVFNWLNEYPKMLGGKTPGIVICAIGANDGQGIEVNKKAFKFGTAAWDEEYARRVGAFSELLLKGGAKVYWVLLPHMRSPVYDQRMQNLNTFLQAKFKDVPNLVFISPDSLIAGRSVNAYVESAQVNGKQVRLRGEDGIHLSDGGARNLAEGILKSLQQN